MKNLKTKDNIHFIGIPNLYNHEQKNTINEDFSEEIKKSRTSYLYNSLFKNKNPYIFHENKYIIICYYSNLNIENSYNSGSSDISNKLFINEEKIFRRRY